jgi:hypothetical protein
MVTEEVTEKSPKFSHFLEKLFPKSPQIAKRKKKLLIREDTAIRLLTEGRSSTRLEGQCAAANFQGKEEIACLMRKLQVRL